MALDLDGAQKRADEARVRANLQASSAQWAQEALDAPIRQALFTLGQEVAAALIDRGHQPVTIHNDWHNGTAARFQGVWEGWIFHTNPGRIPFHFLTTDGYFSEGGSTWSTYNEQIHPDQHATFGTEGLNQLVARHRRTDTGWMASGLHLVDGRLHITYDRMTSDFGPDMKTFNLEDFRAEQVVGYRPPH